MRRAVARSVTLRKMTPRRTAAHTSPSPHTALRMPQRPKTGQTRENPSKTRNTATRGGYGCVSISLTPRKKTGHLPVRVGIFLPIYGNGLILLAEVPILSGFSSTRRIYLSNTGGRCVHLRKRAGSRKRATFVNGKYFYLRGRDGAYTRKAGNHGANRDPPRVRRAWLTVPSRRSRCPVWS